MENRWGLRTEGKDGGRMYRGGRRGQEGGSVVRGGKEEELE